MVVNDGAWGFYRVRYAPDLLRSLSATGLAAVCDPLERMALVADYWAQQMVGDKNTGLSQPDQLSREATSQNQ